MTDFLRTPSELPSLGAASTLTHKTASSGGHYDPEHGEILADRFNVIGLLGCGSYGTVVSAIDTKRPGTTVAIKVVRADAMAESLSQTEANIIQLLNMHDPDDKLGVVRKMDVSFRHGEHLCFVFEWLHETLSTRMVFGSAASGHRELALPDVRNITRQLLTALEFLASRRVVHCDLKPDNIMLTVDSQVKLIDFGLAHHPVLSKDRLSVVQTLNYRAPEVLLGVGKYGCPADMWSLGCTMAYLLTGSRLFSGYKEHTVVRQIVHTLGPPPVDMLEKGASTGTFFNISFEDNDADDDDDDDESPTPPALPPSHSEGTPGPKKLRRVASLKTTYALKPPSEAHSGTTPSLREALGWWYAAPKDTKRRQAADLIERMLTWDPAKRITPTVALSHPFFS